MVTYSLLRKGLAFVVILLFIGVAVTPSINIHIVRASAEDDLVEITTEACGFDGATPKTVKLTRQQYAEIEQLFDDIKIRLDEVETREEAEIIFKEAVVELDKYGLLPEGITIEQAQRLVTKDYRKVNELKVVEKILSKYKQRSENINLFCLVVGRTNYTWATNWVATGILLCADILISLYLSGEMPFTLFELIFLSFCLINGILLIYLVTALQVITNLNPLAMANIIGIGAEHGYNGKGWVKTVGMQGVVNWEGELVGKLPGTIVTLNPPFYYYPAIGGFYGIKIMWGEGDWNFEKTYIGSAVIVGLGEEG